MAENETLKAIGIMKKTKMKKLKGFVANFFGCNEKCTFSKVVKRVFASCVTLLLFMFTCIMAYAFSVEIVYEEFIRPYTSNAVWQRTYISNRIVLKYMCYTDEIKVYDAIEDKVLLRDVDWVVRSADNDSLAVYARKGRRGYINRFTGEVAIPELYTRAWVFSEGLAAVEKDGELLFIDHAGKVVIDKDFKVRSYEPKYAFKNGYCAVEDPQTGKMGLIDSYGNWALEAEFDSIFNNEGFWQVSNDGYVGLFTAELDVMFPMENSAIYIYDGIIDVRNASTHIAKCYDFEGNIINDFMIDRVDNLYYQTAELNNDLQMSEYDIADRAIYGVANSMCYMVKSGNYNNPEYYGLMDRNGKIITPPLYTSIKAIGRNLYLCNPQGVIINDRGEIVNDYGKNL